MNNDDESTQKFNRKVLVWSMIFSGALTLLCCAFSAVLAIRLT